MPSIVVIVVALGFDAEHQAGADELAVDDDVQAPQSPEPQPSLLPVRLSSSRSTSSMVCCGSHRNSTARR